MIGKWIEITGEIEVLTPLHIGSGDDITMARSSDETVQIAAIARDHLGQPYLPGSSLKGVLKRQIESSNLFGPDKIDDPDDAFSGAMIFRNAWVKQDSPKAAKYVATERKLNGNAAGGLNSFFEVHVAREDDIGVAARGLLFHADMVLPGTIFEMRLALQDSHIELLNTHLTPLLKAFAAPDGVAFGRGTQQGQGRLQLRKDSVKAGERPGFDFVDCPLVLDNPAKPNWRLILTSNVPFLIHDPMRKPAKAGDKEKLNSLRPLADFSSADSARLTGSSFLGALRSAFEDFEMRQHLQGLPSDPKSPTNTQVLFGTVDRRGMLGITAIKTKRPGKTKNTVSVKIDRFSGAPIDNALFEIEGKLAPEYTVDLNLPNDAKLNAVQKAEVAAAQAMFDDFLKELQDPIWGGIMLGHAVNRGFGWFKVGVL
jgi:RAMP superfamily